MFWAQNAPKKCIAHKKVDMDALKQGADALFILLGGVMVLAKIGRAHV